MPDISDFCPTLGGCQDANSGSSTTATEASFYLRIQRKFIVSVVLLDVFLGPITFP